MLDIRARTIARRCSTLGLRVALVFYLLWLGLLTILFAPLLLIVFALPRKQADQLVVCLHWPGRIAEAAIYEVRTRRKSYGKIGG